MVPPPLPDREPEQGQHADDEHPDGRVDVAVEVQPAEQHDVRTAPAAMAVGRTQGLVNQGLVIVLLVLDLRICCGIRRLDKVDVRFSCWRALSTEVFVVAALQNRGWRR